MELAVKTLAGKAAGNITLDDAIFGIEDIRKDLLHRTVRWQLAKRQAGTHKTKTRSEVARTTKKSIRQKGSGGARHGSRNAPIFVGGGTAHGPRVRSHAHDLPKKVRKLALAHALSSKVVADMIMVIDVAVLKEAKTKDLAAHFAGLGIENALIISGKSTLVAEENKIVFEVAITADKKSIKEAVEALFKVDVTAVNTVLQKGKTKRFKGHLGRRNDIKKAYVTLAEGQSVDISTGL